MQASHMLIAFGCATGLGLFVLTREGGRESGFVPLALELDFGIHQVVAAEPPLPQVAVLAEGAPASADVMGANISEPPSSPAVLSYGLDEPVGPTPGAPDEQDGQELERRTRLKRYYAEVPVDALVDQHRRLARDLGQKINSQASASFASGAGVAPGPEELSQNGSDRWGQMVRYASDPNGHKLRVVLYEEDYPKLYDMRRELDWIYGEVRRRKQR
ncbi:MAG: hypothetical protein ACI841_002498 [Planctomycetota bacterium]|jgi:hypothetical protein